MSRPDSLLFELFSHLRRLGLPLGVDDYLAVLDLLSQGIGATSVESLQATCRILWAKSPEDLERLDEAFALLVVPRLRLAPQPAAAGASDAARAATKDVVGGAQPPLGGEVPPSQPKLHAAAAAQLQRGAVPVGRLPYDKDADAPTSLGSYQLIPRLPMERREMATIWRHLRLLQRQGPETELDVEGTIEQVSRYGSLMQPTFRSRRRNRVRLLMLIDRASEMSPFDPFIAAFLESVRRGGLLGRVVVYYFEGCPGSMVFAAPELAAARPLEQVLAEHARDGSVAVVGDAGAARGEYSIERVREIQAFLRIVRSVTYRYVWLNPLPRDRWPVATAGEVARMAPMFAMDRAGMIDAVSILRGHPFPPGVNLDVRWD
jgi:hypothetical protein